MITSPIISTKLVEIAAVVCNGMIFDLGGRGGGRRRMAAAAASQQHSAAIGELRNFGPTHDMQHKESLEDDDDGVEGGGEDR